MKQLELIASQSRTTPNKIGRKNPPRPPARPTMPVTTPILSGKSSPTYLKVDAIPHANATPRANSNIVKPTTGKPIWNWAGPRIVWMMNSVCGKDRRNKQIHAVHNTHQVTLCAPKRSASQPPRARNTPAGREKHAASNEACARLKSYSCTKYCGIHTDSAVNPPKTIE